MALLFYSDSGNFEVQIELPVGKDVPCQLILTTRSARTKTIQLVECEFIELHRLVSWLSNIRDSYQENI